MAYKNKIINNPKTGQSIRFIKTAEGTHGVLLEMESTYQSMSKEPTPHYHPQQEEDFEVIEGELTVKIDGQLRVFKAGSTLHVPKNTVHSMWNNSEKKTVINWKVRPALNTENFLETAMGLAMDGKTNKEGLPPLLQVAILAKRYSNVFRLAKPPYLLQKILFSILIPFAYLKGFTAVYLKYIN